MTPKFTEDKKADILISALEERYVSIHKIRERVQGVNLWALGLLGASAGWLMTSDIHFRLFSAILIGGAIFLAYWILRHRYFADLETGFRSQMRTAARLEEMLNLYEPGYFAESKSAYPIEWKDAGVNKDQGNYFRSSYDLMEVGLFIFYVALLLKTCL